MAFHIDTYDLPRMTGYASAYAHWEKAEPWPSQRGEYDGRPLAGRNRKNKVIRKLNDGAIALRLHNTDVVIYRPDERITINAYPSISTDLFANRLLPNGVIVSLNQAGGYYVRDGVLSNWQRFRSNTITLTKHNDYYAAPRDQLQPLVQFRINRRKADLVAKVSGLKDFSIWYKAYVGMRPQGSWHQVEHIVAAVEIPDLLKQGSEGWMKLAKSQYAYATAPQFLNFLKKQVYSRNHQIFNATSYNSFTWRTLTNTLRTNARYGIQG